MHDHFINIYYMTVYIIKKTNEGVYFFLLLYVNENKRHTSEHPGIYNVLPNSQ